MLYTERSVNNTKSKVIDARTFFRKAKTAISIIFNDCITLYSAQASFFIITASIPFVILLLSLAKYVIDVNSIIAFIQARLDGQLGNIIIGILNEVVGKAGISLVSVTAVSTLWASSRGVNSVIKGVSEVYGVKPKENFIYDVLRSFIYTIAFMFILIGTLIALVFGRSIARALRSTIPIIYAIFEVIDQYSFVAIFILLTLFFALIYNTGSKKGRRVAKEQYKELEGKVPRGYLAQLPGAAFAALGWLIFSYLFSLYVTYFPSASYIYGSLTAVVLLMLWLYSCMIILLLGAEINKFILIIKNNILSKK